MDGGLNQFRGARIASRALELLESIKAEGYRLPCRACTVPPARRIFSRFEKLDAMFLGFLSFVRVVDGLRG